MRHWSADLRLGDKLLRRARAVVEATLRGKPVPRRALARSLIPVRVYGVGVTLYHQGMLGCWIGLSTDLDEALVRGAAKAANDPRYPRIALRVLPRMRIAVSVLYQPRHFGPCRKAHVASQLELGHDTLGVSSGEHFAMILEAAAPHHALTRLQLTQSLLRKAHLTDRPVRWCAYSTASWLECERRPRVRRFGFCEDLPAPTSAATYRADLRLTAKFLAGTLGAKGPAVFALNPVTGERGRRCTPAEKMRARTALAQAGAELSASPWRRRAHQARVSGAFPSPGEPQGLCSHTAWKAIGLADAWLLARMAGDGRRARRYAQAWSAAIELSRQLIVREIDAPMLKEPSRSIGGVRVAQASALMTTDAASYLTLALAKGLYAMRFRASTPSIARNGRDGTSVRRRSLPARARA